MGDNEVLNRGDKVSVKGGAYVDRVSGMEFSSRDYRARLMALKKLFIQIVGDKEVPPIVSNGVDKKDDCIQPSKQWSEFWLILSTIGSKG